jgi:Zn-dependent protease
MSVFSVLWGGFNFTAFGVPVTFSFGAFVMFGVMIWMARDYIKKHWDKSHEVSLVTASVIAAVIIMLSLALHEMAHGFTAYYFDIPITRGGFTFLGAYVVRDPMPFETNKMDFFISLAGPLTNVALYLISAFLVWILPESLSENTIQCVAWANLRLWKLNLLPVAMLDGGKLLQCILVMFCSPTFATTIGSIVTFFVLYAFFSMKEKPLILERELETL